MNRLYNSATKAGGLFKNARKPGIFLLVVTLSFAAISCRKAATATGETTAMRPAGDAIAQADQLFTGRADLVKVRQGIIALRQAQAEDQGNYELAWRLAKFNYYLGAHSPDSSEQEQYFPDGLDAGTLA